MFDNDKFGLYVFYSEVLSNSNLWANILATEIHFNLSYLSVRYSLYFGHGLMPRLPDDTAIK